MYRIKNSFIIILLWLISSFAIAQNPIDSLQKALKNAKEDTNKVNSWLKLSSLFRFNDVKKSQEYTAQALKLAEKLNYNKGIGFAYVELGIAADIQGDYKKALYYYEKAEPVFQKNNILRGQAVVLQNRAMLYYYQADYLKAQKNYLDALRVFEQIRDKVAETAILNNLGALFEAKKDYPNALRYFLAAFKAKQKLNKPAALASTLNNIGNVYMSLNQIDTAKFYFEQALQNANQYNNKQSQAMALTNLGAVCFEQGKYENALQYHEKALKIDSLLQTDEGIGVNLINMGHNLLKLKRYAESIKKLEQGLKIVEKIDYKHHVQNALKFLAEGYAELKEFEKSYQFQQRYITIHDSIYTEESNQKINELQTLYETEKKDKQIAVQALTIENQRNTQYFLIALAILLIFLGAVLWNRYQLKIKTNRLLDAKNRELAQLNATKDKLFAVVAHDLKNPLSAFRSITQSLSENVLNVSKEEIDYFIRQLNQSANQLFDLLQNLLNWAVSQIGKLPFQPENLNVKTIVEETLNLLKINAEAKNQSLIANIPEAIQVRADRQMLRTILRNLLSNAIKFTPENGKININTSLSDNYTQIEIKDTGIGLSANDIQKLFNIEEDVSQVGDSPEKGTGLGLLLCKELVEKHNGKIWVESEQGKGSKFCFTIPNKLI
jgi:signal transduction histidine kinase